MNKQEFEHFAKEGFTHVPIVRTEMADFDTPLSIYLKLAASPYSYLFESAAQGGERWNRFSIIGLPCKTVIRVTGNHISFEKNGQIERAFEHEDPLSVVESFHAKFKIPQIAGVPRFFGGLVGYFGYDTVRYVEKRLRDSVPKDTIRTPDILLMLSEDLIVFDNVTSHMQLVTLADLSQDDAWEKAHEHLNVMVGQIRHHTPMIPNQRQAKVFEEEEFVSEYGRENFMHDVNVIKEYIRAGDVMQVVLAQRLSVPFEIPPLQLYRALRSLDPSPYMYFMDLEEFHIVASTPEILARIEDGNVVNRPLAGTRRRGRTPEEDIELEKELLSDPKELSEHLMLIDLGRNDLGRVSKIGSVRVTEKFVVERYSHVMHISSNVEGVLREGVNAIEVLRATLPVGTLSGAPKIRAMEIIDELEPVKRGVYGGAVGYLAWNGNMDMAIAIRTAVIKDGRLYIEAGGGIVADSDPRLEWKESMNKARGIIRASKLAGNAFGDL